MTKTVKPATSIPEIDIKDSINKAVEGANTRTKSLEDKVSMMEAERNVMATRAKAKKEHELSDDELEQVEKLMVDHQIPNYKTAAEFFRLQSKAATPTPSTMTRVEMPRDAMAAFGKGVTEKSPFGGVTSLNAWARDVASKTLDELKAGRKTA
jgi:hypothetical protein